VLGDKETGPDRIMAGSPVLSKHVREQSQIVVMASWIELLDMNLA